MSIRLGGFRRRTHPSGYDLATKKVGYYNLAAGGLWPRSGPSVGKDGTVYAGSGDGDY